MSKLQADAAAPAVDESIPPAPGARRVTVQAAVQTAARRFEAGRVQEADHLIRQVVAARPNNADAQSLFGVILHAQGKVDEAVEAIRAAIKINPAVPGFYSNLGEMERQRGNLSAAKSALKRALKLEPRSAQALNNLGIVHYDKREFDNALDCYREAVGIDGRYPEAHNNWGNALRALGRLDEALEQFERAVELRANYAEAYNNMATALRDQGRFEEAEFAYRRAAELRPSYLEAQNNLVILLLAQDRSEEALRLLGEMLKRHPRHVPSLVNVARAQLRLNNFQLAHAAAKRALAEMPQNVDALCLYGQACHELDRYDEAVTSLEKALALRPDNIECLNYLGIALKSVGQLDRAKQLFIKALELQPRAFGAFSNLVDLERFTPDDPLFTAMKRIIDQAEEPQHERFTALHFGLGKAYDDTGDYESAFQHFSIGAALKRKALNYDEAELVAFMEGIRSLFTREFLEARVYEGHPTTVPIFIVGMPRSGSTLTEQVLSSHPDVYGAGEVKLLNHCLGLARQRFPNLPKFPEMARRMKPHQFGLVADAYIQNIGKVSAGCRRATDKMLTNFYFCGLINLLFPSAKIIHTRRNPLDTCLSAFTKLFKDDMPHSYDLGELGRYYKQYEMLMDHWRSVLPPAVMMDVTYEGLVKDLEGNARALLEFCGLEWNDQCLAFHESSRPVKTASVSQVRKPIYHSSVERWRRYERHLQPLLKELGHITFVEEGKKDA